MSAPGINLGLEFCQNEVLVPWRLLVTLPVNRRHSHGTAGAADAQTTRLLFPSSTCFAFYKDFCGVAHDEFQSDPKGDWLSALKLVH